MATLGSIFAGSWLAVSGGEKPKTAQGPPINASSKDEENFVQYVQHRRREQRTTDHELDLISAPSVLLTSYLTGTS